MEETSKHSVLGRYEYFALRKRLKFYQTRSNAIILHETLPAYCIPKVARLITGEVFYEKVSMSPRPPPKISLKHDWKREMGSEDAQRPEGQVVQQIKSFQSNQPIPNPDHDRTQPAATPYWKHKQQCVQRLTTLGEHVRMRVVLQSS